jgi:recombinational DNA repair protein (RecF pathway)
MINPNPPASGTEGAVAAYEELRSHLLAGSPSSRHFGLILLLREGIAAWIERCAACSAPPAQSATPQRALAGPLLSEQLAVEIVRVLASIALTGREEMRP